MRSSRRCRSKSRKPKYVSLRLHLAPPPPPPPPPPEPSDMSSSAAPKGDCDAGRRHHQLDLFPLHPEQLDRDPHVACLLDDRVGCGQPTLAALLGCCGVSSSSRSPSPPSMNWEEAEEGGGDGDGLARRALRGRERWVYCRSSSAASSEEEVASSAAAGDCGGGSVDLWRCAAPQALALKLDYEEILAAWSDRGPLYMDGEGPQVVPQLHRSANPYDSAAFPVLVEVGGSGGGSSPWKVPEQRAWDGDGAEEKERSGMSREARLMRYKEKRGNRLFVKRIRYEVRKLNAEKRPRVKGRFVRRKDEDHS